MKNIFKNIFKSKEKTNKETQPDYLNRFETSQEYYSGLEYNSGLESTCNETTSIYSSDTNLDSTNSYPVEKMRKIKIIEKKGSFLFCAKCKNLLITLNINSTDESKNLKELSNCIKESVSSGIENVLMKNIKNFKNSSDDFFIENNEINKKDNEINKKDNENSFNSEI